VRLSQMHGQIHRTYFHFRPRRKRAAQPRKAAK